MDFDRAAAAPTPRRQQGSQVLGSAPRTAGSTHPRAAGWIHVAAPCQAHGPAHQDSPGLTRTHHLHEVEHVQPGTARFFPLCLCHLTLPSPGWGASSTAPSKRRALGGARGCEVLPKGVRGAPKMSLRCSQRGCWATQWEGTGNPEPQQPPGATCPELWGRARRG